jgi:hypothetical protein
MAGRGFLLALGLLLLLTVPAVAGAHREYWGCFQRQPDGQCVVTVSIGNSFPAVDQQVIREVLADFSLSLNIEAVEAAGGSADVSIVQGCVKGQCGFFTDMRTRKVYIDRPWSYANYCCDAHDGMRGVYCHEFMHAIAGIGDLGHPRLQPSCFNGTSPFLGAEDFADIAASYPLP